MTGTDKPVRIALIWPYYPPEMGAASNRGTSLAACLTSHGFEVEVCAPRPSYMVANGEPPPIVPVGHRVPAMIRSRRRSRTLRMIQEAVAAIITMVSVSRPVRRSDIVVVSSPPLLVGLACVLAARLAKRPVLLDVRDLWPDVLIESGELRESRLTRLAASTACLAYREATVISVVTRGSISKIIDQGGEREKIILAPNGVEAALVTGGSEDRRYAEIREIAARAANKRSHRIQFRMIYSGLLGPAQGVGALLDALGEIDTPIRVDIVGEGSQLGGLLTRASELDVEFRFHGLVNRREALTIAAQADAAFVPLASSAMADTIPSKMFEAMALGIPVIAVTSGEAARIVENSGGGLVSEPGDPVSLASNVATLINDRELAVQMGASGREFVSRNCTREQYFLPIIEAAKKLSARPANETAV